MIYDSFDTIPFKLFLKISQTGNLNLLSDEKKMFGELEKAWQTINEEFNELDPQKTVDKTLKLLIKIEKYTIKYNALQMGVQCLRFDRDLDLENAIRESGFRLEEETYYEDLDRVERESEALKMLIDEASAKLPKVNDKRATNIDEVIMGYCAITGLQYDTNKITGTQFYGVKSLFEEKKKNLERQQAQLKSKKK